MARHRNIRNLNYDDECDFDDVYGRSVEEELCISPNTAAEFLYDRGSKSTNMSAFFSQDENIAEEVNPTEKLQESELRRRLNDMDKARLNSCLDEIRSIIGEIVPEKDMIEIILKNDFDINKSVDALLVNHTTTEEPKPQRQRKERRRNTDDFSNSEDESDNNFSYSESDNEEEELDFLLKVKDKGGYGVSLLKSSNPPNQSEDEKNVEPPVETDSQEEVFSSFNLSKFLPKPASSVKKTTNSMVKNIMQNKILQNCVDTKKSTYEKLKLNSFKSSMDQISPNNFSFNLNPNSPISGLDLHDSITPALNEMQTNKTMPLSESKQITSIDKELPVSSLQRKSNINSFSPIRNAEFYSSSLSVEKPVRKHITPPPSSSLQEMLDLSSIMSLNDLAKKHMTSTNAQDLLSKKTNSVHFLNSSTFNNKINKLEENDSYSSAKNIQESPMNVSSNSDQLSSYSSSTTADERNQNFEDLFSSGSNVPSINDLASKHLQSKKVSSSVQEENFEQKKNKEIIKNSNEYISKLIDSLENSSCDSSEYGDKESNEGSFDLNIALKPSSFINGNKSLLKIYPDSDQFSPVSSFASEDSGFSSSSCGLSESVQNPIRSAHRSSFGAIICLQLKPHKSLVSVYTDPYISVFGSGSITPFDFTIPSPDDIVFTNRNFKRL